MVKKYQKDYVTIALAQCMINSWKEYKKFEKDLMERLKERGFKETDVEDTESFISDKIIGDGITDGVEFEKDFKQKIK